MESYQIDWIMESYKINKQTPKPTAMEIINNVAQKQIVDEIEKM